MRGRGCVDQIFALKRLLEKFIKNSRRLFAAFMDLGRHMTGLTGKGCGMFEGYIVWEKR